MRLNAQQVERVLFHVWAVQSRNNGMHRSLWLAVLCLLAFGLSCAYVSFYLRGGPRIIDATSYFLEARSLAAGSFTFHRPTRAARFRGRFLLASPDGQGLGVIFPPGYPLVPRARRAARVAALGGSRARGTAGPCHLRLGTRARPDATGGVTGRGAFGAVRGASLPHGRHHVARSGYAASAARRWPSRCGAARVGPRSWRGFAWDF